MALLASGLPQFCELLPVRLTLCDFGAPGWGEPWFPRSVVLVSFLTEFVYGGFCDCCRFCFVWFDRHSNPEDDTMDDTMLSPFFKLPTS